MIEKVMKTIKENNMIENGDTIILGLSGGADSLSLFYILNELKDYYNIKIIGVHINHGVRGDEAKRDENIIKNICKENNIPLDIYSFNMEEYAKEHRLSDEEAGREFRYNSYDKSMKKYNGDKIALGHNLNDSVETQLLNFFRGSGSKGLAGIPKVRDNIIRPLIDCEREEIEKYMEKNNYMYIIDSTNKETDYRRNYIRLEIIPKIKENINPNILNTLYRVGEVFENEDIYLDKISEKEFNQITNYDNNILRINKNKFYNLDKAIKSRIAIKAIYKINKSLKDFTNVHISSILDIGKLNTGKEVHLPNNIIVQNSYDDIIIYKEGSIKSTSIKKELKDGDFFNIYDNIYLSVNNTQKYYKQFVNICTNVFDYDKMEDGKIILRTRKAGDRIFIETMGGSKKIKDYFIDNKVERIKRDNILLIAKDNNIIWILDEKGITDNRYLSKNKNNGVHIGLWRIADEGIER